MAVTVEAVFDVTSVSAVFAIISGTENYTTCRTDMLRPIFLFVFTPIFLAAVIRAKTPAPASLIGGENFVAIITCADVFCFYLNGDILTSTERFDCVGV